MRWLVALAALLLAGCTSDAPEQGAAPEPEAPPSARRHVWDWDPRAVADLPRASRQVAPGLPSRVTPPERAPGLAAHPLDAAVLTVERGNRHLLLLGSDGSWRQVRPRARYGREALSPDGRLLAILHADHIEVWDLRAGARRALDLPERFRRWDFSRLDWVDDVTLLLDDRAGGWLVDSLSGTARRAPYPRWFSWTVTAEGDVLETADAGRRPALVDWSDGTGQRVGLSEVGSVLQTVRAGAGLVAGTAYGDEVGGLLAFTVDRDDHAVLDTLRMRDFEGNYSNWGLRTVHVLDDGSVLLWVAIPGRRSQDDGWRLVRWEPETDALQVVTTSPADPTWSLTFARDLIEAGGPWDPRRVDDLPAAPDDVAPLLPEVLDIPASTPALASDPVEAAVLTVGSRDAVQVLGVDGRWRQVPLPRPGSTVQLTRDGTRLVVSTRTGAAVWDLASGSRTPVASPERPASSESPSWQWIDDRTLLWDQSWRVDTSTGEATRVRGTGGQVAIDGAGGLHRYGWGTGLEMRVVEGDTVAGTGWSQEAGSLAVTLADRAGLTPRAVLPVRPDGQGILADGGLSVQALLDDGTVLLRVLTPPWRDPSIRFVTWDPATGGLALVMRTTGVLPAWSVAVDLLG